MQTFWEQMNNWKNSSELNNNKNMILSVTEVWDCNFCVFFSAKERSLFRIKQISSECKQKNTQEKWTCTLRKITLFCFIRLKKNNKIMISWTPNTYLRAFVQNVFPDSSSHVQKCLKKKREATWVQNIVVELNNQNLKLETKTRFIKLQIEWNNNSEAWIWSESGRQWFLITENCKSRAEKLWTAWIQRIFQLNLFKL